MRKIKDWLLPALVIAMAIVVVHDHIAPRHIMTLSPTKPVDGAAIGRAYATTIAATLADAWRAAADAFASGKTVGEAQAVFQDSWKKARGDAFVARVAPEFAKVLPEGSEPKDAAQRAATVALWRDFARGLKGGR